MLACAGGMEETVPFWTDAGAKVDLRGPNGSNALMLGAAAVAIVRFRLQCHRFDAFWSSPTGAAIADRNDEKERHQLVAQLRLDRRMSALQKQVECLAQQSAASGRASGERVLPIDNAVRLARNGASVEQLTQTCGLNIGEARLMQKLHGKSKQAAST